MEISFDDDKRTRTLLERGLDFADAPGVFNGHHFTLEDDRRDYGELRFITVGLLKHRMVVLVWTERENCRHIISLRKANVREQEKYRHHLD